VFREKRRSYRFQLLQRNHYSDDPQEGRYPTPRQKARQCPSNTIRGVCVLMRSSCFSLDTKRVENPH